jgi:integrase
MSTHTKRPVPPRRKSTKSRPVVGSVSKRKKTRADGSTYTIFRARLVDPDNRDARMEQTFSQTAHGGLASARKAAEDWLKTERDKINAGTWQDPRKPAPLDLSEMTFTELVEAWRGTWDHKPLAKRTQAGYNALLNARLIPEFGDRKVCDITTHVVQQYVNALAGSAKMPGKGQRRKPMQKVHPTTVHRVYAILRLAMRHAVRIGCIPANPCASDHIELPSRRHRPGQHSVGCALSWDELRQLVAAMPEHWRTPVTLAVVTGIRASELWGLCRRDWDSEKGTIAIRQTLGDVSGTLIAAPAKTEASERTLSVPESLHAALNAAATAPRGYVRSVRNSKQRGYRAMVTGNDGEVELGYVSDSDDGRRLLFTLPGGQAVRHSGFYRKVYRPTVKALWPDPSHRLHRARFHDLRHSQGTNLLYMTNNPTEVQKRLGHSTLAITTDLYGRHADEARDKLLAARIGQAWDGDDLSTKRLAKQAS